MDLVKKKEKKIKTKDEQAEISFACKKKKK